MNPKRSFWFCIIIFAFFATCSPSIANHSGIPSFEVFGVAQVKPHWSWEYENKWVEKCTGKSTHWDAIQWHVADSIKDIQGNYYRGLYIGNKVVGRRIFLALPVRIKTVRHELLHSTELNHDDYIFQTCLAGIEPL